MYEVTLVFANGESWFAGGFPNIDAAWEWIDHEKDQQYWDEATQVNVVEIIPPPPSPEAQEPNPKPNPPEEEDF